MTNYGKTSSLALRLFCAMLLVMLGFAHQPVAASAMPMDMSAFALPDGSLPTICIPPDTDDQTGKDARPRCDACRIASVAALPTPSCYSAAIAPARFMPNCARVFSVTFCAVPAAYSANVPTTMY